MRTLAVQQLALAVRQRADAGGQANAFGSNSNEFITDVEMLTMLNASLGELWDILITKFPENYSYGYDGNSSGIGYLFPIEQGTYQYNLPFDFYKEKGVDLSLDASLQNWSTMRPYTLRDRNLFSYPLQTVLAYAGWQNMRWQISTRQPGQRPMINFLPKQGPLPGTVRLLYATAAPVLCPTLPSAYAISTSYNQGDLVYVALSEETGEPINQVFTALNAGTSGTVGILSIGTSTAKVTYTALQPQPNIRNILLTQQTGGSPGVAVVVLSTGDVGITVTTGSDSSRTVANLVNADPVASLYVSVVGAGVGAAIAGSGVINTWSIPGAITDNNILWAYQGPLSLFTTVLDGISGYEDLVVLDAAIKCMAKEESDVSALMAQKAAWMQRIEYAASNRNAGDPMVISGGFGQTEGGTNYGGGFGPWSGGGW